MGWLTGLIAIIEAVPSFIQLVEQVVAAINGHPKGTVAGVAALKAHLATMPTTAAQEKAE